nr:recombinase family protein [Arthrobacter sp. H41]
MDQNAHLQQTALRAAGCSRIFTDHGVSGTRASRPALDKLLDHLGDGDEVVVWMLDQLGGNTRNMLTLIDDLERDQLAERTRAAMAVTARCGRNAGRREATAAHEGPGLTPADAGKIRAASLATVCRYLSIDTNDMPGRELGPIPTTGSLIRRENSRQGNSVNRVVGVKPRHSGCLASQSAAQDPYGTAPEMFCTEASSRNTYKPVIPAARMFAGGSDHVSLKSC